MVIATPVLPSIRVGTVAGLAFGASSCAPTPPARLAAVAVAVASAPAWRNVRRSVRWGASWAMCVGLLFWGLSVTTILRAHRLEHNDQGEQAGNNVPIGERAKESRKGCL